MVIVIAVAAQIHIRNSQSNMCERARGREIAFWPGAIVPAMYAFLFEIA